MPHKILSVDDSRTVRIIVRKAFRSYACDIAEAGNGAEALAAIAKDTPALILLDVTMPVMDGVELLTRLKADPALATIPVVMLTAEGAQEQVKKILELGATDYIVKPFKEEQLLEKVRKIIPLEAVAPAAGPVASAA
jgi:two-component system cell cycle response regulator